MAVTQIKKKRKKPPLIPERLDGDISERQFVQTKLKSGICKRGSFDCAISDAKTGAGFKRKKKRKAGDQSDKKESRGSYKKRPIKRMGGGRSGTCEASHS